MNLAENAINEKLERLSGWRREGAEIVKNFQFENFKGALEFVNHVADLAEAADHHPDILIHGWNKVRLNLMTHSSGGLTGRDFDLAAKIDSLLS
ncbi:MAG: 4a-hydroxytetrahydrobiopterin dehydratase [Acidobacteriota bacterium]|nr:MAG: 4a-hydroxytetrahydrobiopterin dehydratase [Acidobacteriota bacterium]